MSETIALFGTSADPPTIGHRAVLSGLDQRYDRVLVWAVDNPFKLDQTPLVHRQHMLKLLLESVSPPLSRVSWMPQLSHRRSIVSVRKARDFWPEARFILVVGSDILGSLQDWYAIDQLLQWVTFLVIPRPGSPIDDWQLEAFRRREGQIDVADFCGPEVSSSDFRLHHRVDVLPKAVWDYVVAHHLYQIEGVHV